MAPLGRPTIFLTYSLSDPLAHEVLTALQDHVDISSAAALVEEVPKPAALRQAASTANVAVAILPPVRNKGRANVIFEAGLAVGSGLPLLVIAQDRQLPGALLDFHMLDAGDLQAFPEALREAVERPFVPLHRDGTRGVAPHAESVGYAQVIREVDGSRISSRWAAKTSEQLLEHVEELFRSSGAQAYRPRGRSTDGPDLVLWVDALLPLLGLPLPVEVIRSTESLSKLRPRLRHTLRASGAQSLLAVAREGHKNHRWSDGRETLLAVTVDSLEEALNRLPPAQAVGALLEGAHS